MNVNQYYSSTVTSYDGTKYFFSRKFPDLKAKCDWKLLFSSPCFIFCLCFVLVLYFKFLSRLRPCMVCYGFIFRALYRRESRTAMHKCLVELCRFTSVMQALSLWGHLSQIDDKNKLWTHFKNRLTVFKFKATGPHNSFFFVGWSWRLMTTCCPACIQYRLLWLRRIRSQGLNYHILFKRTLSPRKDGVLRRAFV